MLKRYLRNPIVIALGFVVVFFLWLAFRPSFSSLIRASTNLFQLPRHRL